MAQTGDGVATTAGTNASLHLDRDQLLDRLRRREKVLDLPGVDAGTIRIQGLSVNDFGAVRGMGSDEDADTADMFKKVCMLGILEPELSVEDLEALGEADLSVVTFMATEIMTLSGMIGKETAADFFGDIQSGKDSSSTA